MSEYTDLEEEHIATTYKIGLQQLKDELEEVKSLLRQLLESSQDDHNGQTSPTVVHSEKPTP